MLFLLDGRFRLGGIRVQGLRGRVIIYGIRDRTRSGGVVVCFGGHGRHRVRGWIRVRDGEDIVRTVEVTVAGGGLLGQDEGLGEGGLTWTVVTGGDDEDITVLWFAGEGLTYDGAEGG